VLRRDADRVGQGQRQRQADQRHRQAGAGVVAQIVYAVALAQPRAQAGAEPISEAVSAGELRPHRVGEVVDVPHDVAPG
jgi:hypothetical protein